MNKFWTWFQQKTGFKKNEWINHNRENWKINLVGHMEEFFIEEGIFIGCSSNIFELIINKKYGDIRYKQLEDEINKKYG